MMHTVGSTTAAINASLSNLQCDAEYTISVYARGGHGYINARSAPIMVFLPARGMHILCNL